MFERLLGKRKGERPLSPWAYGILLLCDAAFLVLIAVLYLYPRGAAPGLVEFCFLGASAVGFAGSTLLAGSRPGLARIIAPAASWGASSALVAYMANGGHVSDDARMVLFASAVFAAYFYRAARAG